MGRGTSKAGKGAGGGNNISVVGGGGGISAPSNTKTLVSKSQVDELTKDFTVNQFLGDIDNNYMGTLNSLRDAAEENAPKTLEIGGYTFESMGSPFTTLEQTGRNSYKDIVHLDYQCNEQVGNEYPVLQVGLRVWRTPKGKVKSEIIRDGYTNKTRFW